MQVIEAPSRARTKAATRPAKSRVYSRPLELFDAATLAGLRPKPRVLRRPAKRHWFTATDLFCGAGGTTTGFEQAMIDACHIVDTLQVVNHDPLAIASHEANHRAAKHFIEDITQLDANLLVRTSLLWASLECTNFSNAKGGQGRDADSRSLAEHMERYIRAVNPLYFCVENVREFMSWGPLYHKKDKAGRPMFRPKKVLEQRASKDGTPLFSKTSGKPLTRQVVNSAGQLVFEQVPVMIPESRTKGRDFIRWKQSIEDLGYEAHQTLLNSADYGERTSRIRLFMVFAKKGLPVRWPQATHSKNGKTVGTEPWLPVRPCLDLAHKGRSIFDRVRVNKKGVEVAEPLVEKTLKRLFAGLCQYIAGSTVPIITAQLQQLRAFLLSGQSGGAAQTTAPKHGAESEWLAKRTSNPPSGRANPGVSLDQPGPAVACGFHPDLVQVQDVVAAVPDSLEFIAKAFSGDPSHLVQGTDAPAGALTCIDHHQLGQVVPAGPQEFLTTRHHTSPESRGRSLEQPAAVVMPKDNHELAQVVVNEQHSKEFLTNPGWPERCGGGATDEPGPTLIARQDKAPLSLVQTVGTGETGFVQKYYSSGPNVTSLNEPSGSLTCTDRMALAQVESHVGEGAWLDKRYGSGPHNHQPLTAPSGAILTNEHHVLAQVEPVASEPAAEFLDQQFGASVPASVQDPAGALTNIPKLNLAQVEPWIVKTDFDRVGNSLDEPSGTLTASRHHPYLAQPEAAAAEAQDWLLDNKFDNTGRGLDQTGPTLLTGDHHYLAQTQGVGRTEPKNWQFQDGDSETMQLIRLFLRAYNLSDVLLRMLTVKELLAIQGFPADYVLKGSDTQKKKFVGNSVCPKMSQRITEALYEALQEAELLDLLTEYTGSLVVSKSGRLAKAKAPKKQAA